MTSFRVGQGFDVHPFADDADRPLIIGGVSLPGPGLGGHSDSDPLAHASADALLGAAGMDDLGQLFPDTNQDYLNADSMELLKKVVESLDHEGWQICNLDCNVILEAPHIAPHRRDIEKRMFEVIKAPVNVRGRSAEGLGAIGGGDGIACLAVALITKL